MQKRKSAAAGLHKKTKNHENSIHSPLKSLMECQSDMKRRGGYLSRLEDCQVFLFVQSYDWNGFLEQLPARCGN